MNQDLVDLIQDGATLVRQSSFSLAVEKAQEKLKKFQLPDPRYYIAQVLQALLASGAQKIEIRIEGSQITLQFDGPGYTRSELENLGDAIFESGKQRDRDRLRELALGLLSVQALQPKEVKIYSQGLCYEKRGAGGVVSPSTRQGQSVVIVHRRTDTEESSILWSVCQACRARITLNGALVSNNLTRVVHNCPWPNTPFEGKGFQGAFGIAYGEISSTALTLTRYGVVFSRRREPRILPSLVVELEHQDLRKNASQSDVVEDQAYTRMLAELQRVQLDFAIKLSEQRIPNYQTVPVRAYFGDLVRQNLTPQLLDLPESERSPLENQLCKARLLWGADDRRFSPLEVWRGYQQNGAVLYSDEPRGASVHLPPGSVLRLGEDAALAFQSLIPRLRKVRWLVAEECQLALQTARQELADNLPPCLASFGQSYMVLDLPPEPKVRQYRQTAMGMQRLEPGADTRLAYAVLLPLAGPSDSTSQARIVKQMIEPLYREIADRLTAADFYPNRSSLQRAVFHYLEYRYGSLSQALSLPEWRTRGLFFTVQQTLVSLEDLQAWLEVYPFVVGTYGAILGSEDYGLALTPECRKALGELLGPEAIRVAHLDVPYHTERGQQLGLSGAATAGVRPVTETDEEEELASLRREIQRASQFNLAESLEQGPLDAEEVMQQLGLEAPALDLARDTQEPLPEFCLRCLEATSAMKTRWRAAFQQPGLQGQILIHEGLAQAPLVPDRLLVKIADNEPVAYPTGGAALTGWLFVPAQWTPAPDFVWQTLRCDSDPPRPGSTWPEPVWPFDLGMPSLHTELTWATRTVFKRLAQHQAGQVALSSGWSRRLSAFMLWDEAWAMQGPGSWFRRIAVFRNLAGQSVDLAALSGWPKISWAPPGPGSADDAFHTVRILPPFTPADLARLTGAEVVQAQLKPEEKKEQQLLGELKLWLAQTCHRAHAPLEPSWVEGLHFGEPTRWLGGPRRYFIEHDPGQGWTRLNPASEAFRHLFKNQKNWEQRVPVLASAVYTAINRALAEVEDRHELAFLEALLSQLP